MTHGGGGDAPAVATSTVELIDRAPRAGVSVFAVSRFMGASIAMIHSHYGHPAGDRRELAVSLRARYGTKPGRTGRASLPLTSARGSGRRGTARHRSSG